jgi:Histidine kinase-like ATPase domain
MQDGTIDPLPIDDVETGDLDDARQDKPWPPLVVRARVLDGVPVLDLSGRLEGSGVVAVAALLTHALASDQIRVPCDLSALEYLSAHAVRKLIEVAAVRPRCPAPVVLCAASGQPARMLAAADPAGALPVYSTVAQAVADPQGQLRWAQLTLTCDPKAPGSARAFVGRVCTSWELEGVVDEATLVASELVTNAVVHAEGAAQIVVQRCADQLTISVRDGTDVPPMRRAATSWEESGRGLQLVDALACADGSYPRSGGGKVVWCSLRLPTGV